MTGMDFLSELEACMAYIIIFDRDRELFIQIKIISYLDNPSIYKVFPEHPGWNICHNKYRHEI